MPVAQGPGDWINQSHSKKWNQWSQQCPFLAVEVRLQASGDAPIMKQKNYKVDGDKKVEWILAFIRKYLKLDESEHLVRRRRPVSIGAAFGKLTLTLVPVPLREPSLLALARPEHPEPLRVLRKRRQAHTLLRQDANVGMNDVCRRVVREKDCTQYLLFYTTSI